jgi:LIM-domain binding protein
MNIILGAPQADPAPQVVECPGASILWRWDNGAQVIWDGSIKAIFRAASDGSVLKIARLEIVNDEFTEFIPRGVAQMLTPPLSNRSTSPDVKRSPPMDRLNDHGDALPRTDLHEMGVPKTLMRFLEVLTRVA